MKTLLSDPPQFRLRIGLAVTGLILLIVLAYSNSFSTSFHSDDYEVIQFNPEMQDVENFLNFIPPRYRQMLHLSFALNHHVGGIEPSGYHWVNLGLHTATTLVIFAIVFLTLRQHADWDETNARWAGMSSAFIFGLHPVHTETVTYISGRGSGLSTFFYLLALLLFIITNIKSTARSQRFAFGLGSLLAGGLALLSKETAITLPLVFFLYDICFMRTSSWAPFQNRIYRFYSPLFMLCLGWIAFSPTTREHVTFWWGRIDLQYAITQVPVWVHSLKLFLFPFNLTFDYHFPETRFYTPGIYFLSFLLLGGLLIIAMKGFSQRGTVGTFCILWFGITLLPTNSFLPRLDLLSERNLYLPFFGLCFLSGVLLVRLFSLSAFRSGLFRPLRTTTLAVAILCLVLLVHQRNTDYRTDITLWQDTVAKSPGKMEVQYYLSMAYYLEGDLENAYRELKSMVATNPEILGQLSLTAGGADKKLSQYHRLLTDLSNLIRSNTKEYGMYQGIYEELKSLTSPNPSFYFTRILLGQNHARQGRADLAEKDFKKAIQTRPTRPEAPLNLGILLASQKLFEKAESQLLLAEQAARGNSPLYADILWNLAKVRYDLGAFSQAGKDLQKFLTLKSPTAESRLFRTRLWIQEKNIPAVRESIAALNDPLEQAIHHHELALHYLKTNQLKEAAGELKTAVALNPEMISAQYNLGALLMQNGPTAEKGRHHLQLALNLSQTPAERQHIRSLLEKQTS